METSISTLATSKLSDNDHNPTIPYGGSGLAQVMIVVLGM